MAPRNRGLYKAENTRKNTFSDGDLPRLRRGKLQRCPDSLNGFRDPLCDREGAFKGRRKKGKEGRKRERRDLTPEKEVASDDYCAVIALLGPSIKWCV